MGSSVVVVINELVEECLQFGEGLGWRLGGEPFLEGLVESFDFPAGGGVVGSGVFLCDAEVGERRLELVASASVAGEAHGVDETVVGEHGGGKPVFSGCFGEGV